MATTNYGFDPEILKRRSEQGQSTGRTAAPFDHKAFEDYLLSRGENQWGGGLPTDEQMQEQVRNFINDVPAVPQFTGQTPQDGQPPAPTSVANQWTQQADQMRQQLQQQTAAPSQVPSQQIYDLISQRMGQSLEIDRNDPIIRQQADAFGAQQERASRNYLADVAESAGPNANLRGEQRLPSERLGQSVGAFEADLMGRELQTRRDQISEGPRHGRRLDVGGAADAAPGAALAHRPGDSAVAVRAAPLP